MLIRKYQQSGKILDKLGNAWNNFWNYQLNVPLSNGTSYGNPFFTGTSNKEPYTYNSTPKTEVAQHTAMLLPLSINDKLAYYIASGMVGNEVGKQVGKQIGNALDVNDNTKQMFKDIGGLLIGGKFATSNNIRYRFKGSDQAFKNRIYDEIQGRELLNGQVLQPHPSTVITNNKDFETVGLIKDAYSNEISNRSFTGWLNAGNKDRVSKSSLKQLREAYNNLPEGAVLSANAPGVTKVEAIENNSWLSNLFNNKQSKMTPDAYKLLTQLGNKNILLYTSGKVGGFKGKGKITDLYNQYKNKQISAVEYINKLNEWIKSFNGRQAHLDFITGKPVVYHPAVYVVHKQ